MIKVTLIEHTPNPERLVAAAAKLCYSDSGVSTIMDKLDRQRVDSFVDMLAEIGHESPTEHVSFTFGIEGVSRALLAQFTRHRIASYSVKSQRYVTEGDFEYIIPPEIENCPEALELYKKTMENDRIVYERLTQILKDKYKKNSVAERIAEKKAIEDARYILPNACETKIVATFNARSLMNFFRLRMCERAQWEIRQMAELMYNEVKSVASTLFKNVGPPCAFGNCPEGKMSCGKQAEKRQLYGRNKKC